MSSRSSPGSPSARRGRLPEDRVRSRPGRRMRPPRSEAPRRSRARHRDTRRGARRAGRRRALEPGRADRRDPGPPETTSVGQRIPLRASVASNASSESASIRSTRRSDGRCLAGSCVNHSPGMESTTREPVPIRAYGCPVGSTPVSTAASIDGMRGRYDTCPALPRCGDAPRNRTQPLVSALLLP